MYYVRGIEHPLGNSLSYQNNASSFDWKCKLSRLQVHLSEILLISTSRLNVLQFDFLFSTGVILQQHLDDNMPLSVIIAITLTILVIVIIIVIIAILVR